MTGSASSFYNLLMSWFGRLVDVLRGNVIVWPESLIGDVRYGLRSLLRNPIFAAATILTIAIGIGANTAVFTLVHGWLLRSLPVRAPHELVRIDATLDTEPLPNARFTYAMFQQVARLERSLSGLSAWKAFPVTITDPDGTGRQIRSALVTGNAFEVLGVPPGLGRLIGPADDVAGGGAQGWPVVLSDSFWREQFGADPRVLGRQLIIAGQPVTVIGVLRASFQGIWIGAEPTVYLPLHFLSVIGGRDMVNVPQPLFSVTCIGRVRPDLSVTEARADLMVHEQRLISEYSAERAPDIRRRMRLVVDSAQRGVPTLFRMEHSATLFLMQGLVAIVLVLCCVNVSGLMLSKLNERQHEFVVRAAIGAGNLRIARQCLTESSIIALAGGALGMALARYGSAQLLPFFQHPTRAGAIHIAPDPTILFMTALSAVAATLFFGLLPAWRAARANPTHMLKSRGAVQRAVGGRGLVAMQVGLSVVLVTLASLLVQSLVRLQNEPTGFSLDDVTIQAAPFHLVLPEDGNVRLDAYDRMIERLGRAPAIRSAAVTWYAPMTGQESTTRFERLGESAGAAVTLAFNHVGAGYFKTMSTRIVAGREFARGERRRDVCVLNDSAVRALFPGQSALGEIVRTADNAGLDLVRGGSGGRVMSAPVVCRVVGIAEDAKFGHLRDAPPRTIYFPLTSDFRDANLVFLLNAPTKANAIAAYREALREIAPSVPLMLFSTLREQMQSTLGNLRAITFLSAFFGAIALLLSALGLYGMLSSSVSRRTAEIGVRTALGASRKRILGMILFDAFRLAAIGAGGGVIGLFFTMRYVEQMLYGVSAFDWRTLAAVTIVLTVVILLASIWPARRAASVDPLTAIRTD